MKNRIILFVLLAVLFSSCTTTYLMVSQGESFDALTKITDAKKMCLYPHWGDSGRDLVFSAREEDGFYNIYMKDNVLSGSLIQKTSGNNYNLCPNYCAANDKIAFQYLNKNNFDIYYINASKGKAITQITSTDDSEYNPAWSNDGKMLVFEKGAMPKLILKSNTSSNATKYTTGIRITENQIWIKNLETGELRMIGQGSFPRFSPDDQQIVFVKYDLNKSKTAETGTLWIMSADGENQKQITGPDLGYASWPNWSPDAAYIVFELTKNDKKDSDIYTINIDGENLKQHTTNKSQDFAPYWTSDGYIYFSSDRGGKAEGYNIWRFKIDMQ
jgi:Tol biopolymer transport system component